MLRKINDGATALKNLASAAKDVSGLDEEISVYEFVEDDKEYDAIAAIFEEIMDDVDFEK